LREKKNKLSFPAGRKERRGERSSPANSSAPREEKRARGSRLSRRKKKRESAAHSFIAGDQSPLVFGEKEKKGCPFPFFQRERGKEDWGNFHSLFLP